MQLLNELSKLSLTFVTSSRTNISDSFALSNFNTLRVALSLVFKTIFYVREKRV